MTYVLAVLLAAFLVAVDQASKYIAVQELMPIGSYSVIRGYFSLTYVENTGAAFGFMQGGRVILVVLTIIIMILICFYYVNLPKSSVSKYIRLALIFTFAGAFGNFIDRARQGYVVDFFHVTFIDFPVFNFADIFIVFGTFLLVIMLIREAKADTAEAG